MRPRAFAIRSLLLFAGLLACALAAPRAGAQTYRLNYEAAVLGVVTIGEVSYEVSIAQGRYAARATVRTAGLARLFDQTQISAAASGAYLAAGPAWTQYDLTHSYAAKFRRIRMVRRGGAVEVEAAPRFGDLGNPPASGAQQGRSHDPVTAIFALGRQVGASQACSGAALVFDGRQHYRLALSGGARADFNGGGYRGPAIRCALRYQPIAGFTNIEEARRAPTAEAWFALPADRSFAPLLRLTAPTPLGPARIDLRRYQGPTPGA